MRILSRKTGLILVLAVMGLGLVCCSLPALLIADLLACPSEPPVRLPSADGEYTAVVLQLGGCYMDGVHWAV
jgi:hypothetical protein